AVTGQPADDLIDFGRRASLLLRLLHVMGIDAGEAHDEDAGLGHGGPSLPCGRPESQAEWAAGARGAAALVLAKTVVAQRAPGILPATKGAPQEWGAPQSRTRRPGAPGSVCCSAGREDRARCC